MTDETLPTPPLTLPGYEVHHRLGAGATGQVWLAREDRTGDLVALKRLHDPGDAAGRERLLREASLLAGFRHDHVIRLRAVETDGAAAPVLVLDHAAGGSLAALLARRGRLEPGEVVTVAAPLAEALAEAHSRGLVHGDVTPGNVLFDAGGRPLLADLGVARLVGEQPGVVESTADYLDPAVAAGGGPTPATDVHALAAVCHHMLTGAPPYAGDSLVQVLRAAAAGERGSLRALAPTAPVTLVDAVESGLAVDPEARPMAAALAEALLAAVPAQPVQLRGVGSAPADPPPAAAAGVGVGTDRGRRWRGRAATRGVPVMGPGPIALPRAPDPGLEDQSELPGRDAGALGAGALGAPVPRLTHAVPVRLAAPVEALPREDAGWWDGVRERWGGLRARPGLVVLVLAALLLVTAGGAAALTGGETGPTPVAVAAPAPAEPRADAPVQPAGEEPAEDMPTGSGGSSGDRSGQGGSAGPTGPGSSSVSVETAPNAVGPVPGPETPPRAATDPPVPDDGWRAVVEGLDGRRAEALARADPALLGEVYAPGSEALAADTTVVAALRAGGVTVRGARHEIQELTVLEEAPGRARLLVVDVLPEHAVHDVTGALVEQRTARAPATVELELVDADGWRIASVRPR